MRTGPSKPEGSKGEFALYGFIGFWLKFGASGQLFFRISHCCSMTYELIWIDQPRCSSRAGARYLRPV